MEVALDLSWLPGVWIGDKWGGRMEERWTPLDGGTMLGVNRLVRDGKSPHREFLSIETDNDRTTMAVYLVRDHDSAVQPIVYTMTDSQPGKATFENPQHERLHTIAYQREGKLLLISIRGVRDGKPMQDDFELHLREAA